ncbi:hypothetical protein QTI48_14960 [Clostridium perfringens]|uniref:DUF6718 family protein n=1 Tax=Clostridium perfringens TaxID=1502 RepID=UPI001CCBA437|nr:DUF6718 family protein [Clostridium perfringens]ELC8426430.1 hypothetical protein [Clostridium perfringens]MDK0637168.1 hypothetical protein [Clostridium perfringens]MDM0825073.1 hypothetical protein [Clostridium perfringens]MDM0871855.1 hypothetical protein [Clostridium perfringens]MDU5543952.1 DUF6718 family protein [Clostridium perfringens]
MKKVLVAKRFNESRSLVLISDDIEKLNSTFDYLTDKSINSDVQIISVKGIENYKEYHPITEIMDIEEFIKIVLKMMQ